LPLNERGMGGPITHGMISINEGGRSYCLVIVNFRRFLAILSLPDLIGE
jgi:hypothetical protein